MHLPVFSYSLKNAERAAVAAAELTRSAHPALPLYLCLPRPAVTHGGAGFLACLPAPSLRKAFASQAGAELSHS